MFMGAMFVQETREEDQSNTNLHVENKTLVQESDLLASLEKCAVRSAERFRGDR